MLGIWKNIEDLELHISIDELEAILEANREREFRMQKFQAALKGIDLEAPKQEEIEERMEKVRLRAQARLTGEDAETLEFDSMGIEVETE